MFNDGFSINSKFKSPVDLSSSLDDQNGKENVSESVNYLNNKGLAEKRKAETLVQEEGLITGSEKQKPEKARMLSDRRFEKVNTATASLEVVQRELFPPDEKPLPLSTSAGNSSANSLPLEHLGSGMDKVFYLPPKSEDDDVQMGFLDCSNNPNVKASELRAYNDLSRALEGTGVKVPKVIDDANKPGPIIRKKSGGAIAQGQGYWIECIKDIKSFKPIMAATSPAAASSVGGKNNPVKLYNKMKLEGKIDEARTLKEGISAILANSSTICDLVGELTMGINPNTGEVYLVDVAPNQGQTATDLVDRISAGLRNMVGQMK